LKKFLATISFLLISNCSWAQPVHLIKSAEQGNANAQTILGIMLANGEAVAKDAAQAVKWYKLAAEQGNAHAQTLLGIMLANGDGVAKDAEQAYFWLLLASIQIEKAKSVRDDFEKNLSQKEIYRMQAKARDWRPKLER